MYKRIYKLKKDRRRRIIHIPEPNLKKKQKEIARSLAGIPVGPGCVGYVKGLSIVNNAIIHLGAKAVLAVDIQDFFPSIDKDDIYEALQYNNVEKERIRQIIDLCYLPFPEKGLPQGSPASPVLSNLVLKKWDYIFSIRAQKMGLKYSRYSDNLFFSGIKPAKILKFLYALCKAEIFPYSLHKIRIMRKHQCQKITGITINADFPSVPKKVRRRLRARIHQLDINNKKEIERIKGYIAFINSVNEKQAEKLRDQLNKKLNKGRKEE